MKKLILTVVLGAALTACASEAPRVTPAKLDYSGMGKIMLDVQDFRAINRSYAVPQRAPFIGNLFQPSLPDAVQRWASDRFQANGSAGHATFIIKEASISEQKLPIDKGVEGWFTRQQDRKYVARVEVELQAQTPVDSATGIASAYATHAVTVSEDPNEYEKYNAYRILLDGLMNNLNQNMEQAIQAHMARFIASPQKAAPPTGLLGQPAH